MKTLEDFVATSSNPAYHRHAIGKLDAPQRARLLELATELEERGAVDALGWAYSELSEGIAQTARFLALRAFCSCARDVTEVLDSCDADDARGLFDTLLQAGADRESLERLVIAVAKSTVWQCLTTLDEGGFGEGLPVGWALAETDADGKLTGRLVGGLHEDAQDDQFLGEFG